MRHKEERQREIDVYSRTHSNKVTLHSLEILENRMRKRVSFILSKYNVKNRIDRFNFLQIITEIMEIDPKSLKQRSPSRS